MRASSIRRVLCLWLTSSRVAPKSKEMRLLQHSAKPGLKPPAFQKAKSACACLIFPRPIWAWPAESVQKPWADSKIMATAQIQQAQELVDFWLEAGPAAWFTKDPEFDARFKQRFLSLHQAAARGELDNWADQAVGSLALVLLLDQFPRNAFR